MQKLTRHQRVHQLVDRVLFGASRNEVDTLLNFLEGMAYRKEEEEKKVTRRPNLS